MQAYAITLLRDKHAQQLLKDCVVSGIQHNWSIQAWPAVDGPMLNSGHFSRLNLYLDPQTKIYQRPGAQGCFLSHWALWHHCREINESIIILENDAVIQSAIPKFNPSQGILKLHRDRGTKTGTSGTWSKGSHAYMLSPTHADQLIQGMLATAVRPVDKAIGTAFVAWRHSDHDVVTLNPLRGPSTTARN